MRFFLFIRYMSRKILHGNALQWLINKRDHSIPNYLSGICDLDETKMTESEYWQFFARVVKEMARTVAPDGYLILIQTDRKKDRRWHSKSALITRECLKEGMKMCWHKIVLHRDVGKVDLYRPTYAHMLCYSKRGTTGAATPDVLAAGTRLYNNGTPVEAADFALEFIKKYSPNKAVVDPFVGRGTIVALANSKGMPALGIDIDLEQAKKARKLEI